MAEVDEQKNPFLAALGERVRALRARRGLTRKAVAMAANVSERHLASLEYGEGNASILVLLQVAGALQCTLAELLGDVTTSSPEWLLLREMLSTRSEADLRRVREQVSVLFGTTQEAARTNRIALIGLRGAGKSTILMMIYGDLHPALGVDVEPLGAPAAVHGDPQAGAAPDRFGHHRPVGGDPGRHRGGGHVGRLRAHLRADHHWGRDVLGPKL